MSKQPYPLWWDTTITIYNRYEDPQTQVVRWYKTILHNCFWKYIGNKITINNTVIETNNIICRIPKQDKYLDKYLWVQKPNDKMADFFTLSPGDIIIKGEVADEIDEYVAGKRSSDVKAKYKELQGCMEIQAVSINTGSGRNNEHYYVTGI